MRDRVEGTILMPAGAEELPTLQDALRYEGQVVTVFSKRNGSRILKGEIVQRSDMIGGARYS